MYVYLAEPIDQSVTKTIAISATIALENRQINHYTPRNAWHWHGELTSEIQQVNDAALFRSSAVLAFLSAGVPTYGVPMECERAVAAGIPVVVLADFPRSRSAAYMHLNCSWLMSESEAIRQLEMLLVMKKEPRMPSEWITPPKKETEPEPLVARWQQEPADIMSHGIAPRTHNPGDAGYDLTCTESMRIPSGKTRSVACGIKVQLPDGYWGLIQGRSSSWKRGLSVKASVIDAGYRGGLWVDLLNIGPKTEVVEAGERIAQIIPMPLAPPMVWLRGELDETERGSNGYGSTGK